MDIENLFVVCSVDFAADWLQSDVGYFTKGDIRAEMRLVMNAPLQASHWHLHCLARRQELTSQTRSWTHTRLQLGDA